MFNLSLHDYPIVHGRISLHVSFNREMKLCVCDCLKFLVKSQLVEQSFVCSKLFLDYLLMLFCQPCNVWSACQLLICFLLFLNAVACFSEQHCACTLFMPSLRSVRSMLLPNSMWVRKKYYWCCYFLQAERLAMVLGREKEGEARHFAPCQLL